MRGRRVRPVVPRLGSQVAVVVPLSDRATLTPDEEISLRHLRRHLGAYDKYAIAPHHLDVTLPDCVTLPFDAGFFGSVAANRRLMVSREFYATFAAYDYILLYHLDALVLSDGLAEWCALGYDYIGAPWLRCPEHPELGFSRVGNGGFSLRRIAAFLAVLESRRYAVDPERYWQRHFAPLPARQRLLHLPRRFLKRLPPLNNVRRELAGLNCNEDFFWADRARHFYPEFRVAPVDVALRFAFEAAPRFCLEANARRLPFGCHAWPKYDRWFWEPYLLS